MVTKFYMVAGGSHHYWCWSTSTETEERNKTKSANGLAVADLLHFPSHNISANYLISFLPLTFIDADTHHCTSHTYFPFKVTCNESVSNGVITCSVQLVCLIHLHSAVFV
jgi:hypothetical protein